MVFLGVLVPVCLFHLQPFDCLVASLYICMMVSLCCGRNRLCRTYTRFFELKSEGYKDGINKIGMGYKSKELLSVQCLQVDDKPLYCCLWFWYVKFSRICFVAQ